MPTDAETLNSISETIDRIENAIYVEDNIQTAYDEFGTLVKGEMDKKLPFVKNAKNQNKSAKSMYKPYWNQTLQNQWNIVCASGSTAHIKKMKEKFCSERKCFDKLNRKFKM